MRFPAGGTMIGLETKAALDKYGIKPDIIIGCAGGGSNLGGLIPPFMGENEQHPFPALP